ncbi:MAG: hypothetical protein OCD02_20180 [Spirochaetaceae bacterium]
MKIKKNIILSIIILILLTGCISTAIDPEIQMNLEKEQISNIYKGWSTILNNKYEDAYVDFNDIINNDELNYSELRSSMYRGLGIASYAKSDDFEAFEMLYKSIELNPNNPYSLVAATFIRDETLWDFTRYKKLIVLLEEIVKDKKTSTWLKREYLYFLDDYYRYDIGDFKKADGIKEKLNIITNWEIIGPYSNISKSGYKNDYILIDEKDPSGLKKAKTGINNWAINTFTPEIKNRALYTPISSYFDSENYTSIYAYKNLSIKEEGNYEFVLSRYGSIEVWINDKKHIEQSSDTGGNNNFYFTVKLNEGDNKILIKSNKLERSNSFNLSYEIASEDHKYNRNKLYSNLFPDESVFDPQLNSLCEQVTLDKSSPEGYIWLSYALLDKGWIKQATKVLTDLKEYNSNGDLYQYFSAYLYKLNQDYPLYNKEIMNLAEKKKSFVPIQLRAAKNYLAMGRIGKAEAFFKENFKDRTEWFYTLYLDLLININNKNDDKVLTIYKKIKYLFPDIPSIDLTMVYNQNNMTVAEKNSYISNLYKSGNYRSALYLDYTIKRNHGTFSQAKEKLKSYLDFYPLNINNWIEYIDLLYNSSTAEYKTIKEVIELTMGTYPNSYDLLYIEKENSRATWTMMDKYYYENLDDFNTNTSNVKTFMSDMESAKETYKNSMEQIIKYYPYSLEIRDELRRLSNKKEFLDKIKIKDSYDIIDKFKKADFIHNPSDATIVYDSQQELYFGDGASSQFHHFIIRVNTLSGIEDNRFINLGFYPNNKYNHVYDAFTLKDDGTRIEADFSGKEVAYSRLSPGDFIVLSYRTDQYESGELNSEIFTQVNLESTYPIHFKVLDIIYPKKLKLNYKYINIAEDEVELTTTSFETSYTKTTVKINNKEAKTFTNFTGKWRDYIPSVEISTLKSWDNILDWYKPLYEGQTIASKLVKQKAEELTTDAKSDNEKIKAIFNFVANKIEYEDLSFQYDGYIPQSADSILKEGYGDCKDQSVLLISMLKSVGIESYLTLNATYYNGLNVFLPSLIFDHAIVAVESDGNVSYLDPTLTYYTYGDMPADRNGTFLLDIKEGGTFHRANYNIEKQKNFSILEIKNIDSITKINGSMIYQGSSAWNIRSTYKDITEDEKQTTFEEHTNSWIPGFKLNTFDLENSDDIFYDPKIEFSGSMNGIITTVDNSLVKINSPWRDYLDNQTQYWLGADPESKTISIPGSRVSTPKNQVIIIDIPNKYKIHSLPQEIKLTFKNSYINFSAQEISGKLVLKRDIFIPEQIVDQNEIDEFKMFIENALEVEKQEVYLSIN